MRFLANLKKILNKIAEAKGDRDLITAAMDKLQPLITAANIGKKRFHWQWKFGRNFQTFFHNLIFPNFNETACDESDFGSAIELGTDLFCFGTPELHSDALQLLATGYKLVKKPQFIAIAKAHMEKRTKSINELSILKTDWTNQLRMSRFFYHNFHFLKNVYILQ